MRANLEPLIDTLFEEDELFAQDFEEDGLNRILFIRKMGIYVEVCKRRLFLLHKSSFEVCHFLMPGTLEGVRGGFRLY